ncbi:hypothetical protein JB92DRAFT_2827602 [Gautieria morchelliformis]|nr:hypothetical protein JB92DRAFT_2827602 [Gautieria morchelliformis]
MMTAATGHDQSTIWMSARETAGRDIGRECNGNGRPTCGIRQWEASNSSIDHTGLAASKFLTSAVWLLICMADSTTVILLAACALSDTSIHRIRRNLIRRRFESLETRRAGREPDTSGITLLQVSRSASVTTFKSFIFRTTTAISNYHLLELGHPRPPRRSPSHLHSRLEATVNGRGPRPDCSRGVLAKPTNLILEPTAQFAPGYTKNFKAVGQHEGPRGAEEDSRGRAHSEDEELATAGQGSCGHPDRYGIRVLPNPVRTSRQACLKPAGVFRAVV